MAPSSHLKELDLVWARQRGYPWWPAVLSPCPVQPNMGQWMAGSGKKLKYHCLYVGWDKERTWLEEKDIRKIKREDLGEGRKKEYIVKTKQFKEQHLEALELSEQILDDPYNPFAYLVKIVKEDFVEHGIDSPGIEGLNSENSSGREALESGANEESKPKNSKPAKVQERNVSSKGKGALKKSKSIKKKEISSVDVKVKQVTSATTIVGTEQTKHDRNESKDERKVEESYFHTIAEKVKNPRKRKPVEKFNNSDEINVGKIGKIKMFLSKRNKSPGWTQSLHKGDLTPHASTCSSPLPAAAACQYTLSGCGRRGTPPAACQCAGCLLADCGQCKFCEDKVCFGGEGKFNERCSRRMCHKNVLIAPKEDVLVVTDETTEVLEDMDGVDLLKGR